MPPKFFTLSEANALLPALTPLIRRLVEAHRAFRASEQQLDAFRARATMEGGVLPHQDLSHAKTEVERLGAEIRTGIGEVDGLGCLVKDLERGLVDFLSLRQGEHVFLCWRLGEPAIDFWHGLEEGFAGRKPIQADE